MTATNYAVAPGEYLKEWIEDHHLTAQDLPQLLTCTPRQVGKLLTGYTHITQDLATRLERVTTIPANAWLRYENQYRADLARIHAKDDM